MFISYHPTNTDRAKRLADWLLERGLDVWFDDRRNDPALTYLWSDRIGQAIRDAAAVVVIDGDDSKQVRQEIALANQLNTPVVPLEEPFPNDSLLHLARPSDAPQNIAPSIPTTNESISWRWNIAISAVMLACLFALVYLNVLWFVPVLALTCGIALSFTPPLNNHRERIKASLAFIATFFVGGFVWGLLGLVWLIDDDSPIFFALVLIAILGAILAQTTVSTRLAPDLTMMQLALLLIPYVVK